MPSILNATTTSGLVTSADNSGSLQLQTNNGTTAVTIDTSQNVLIGGTTFDNGGFSGGANGLNVVDATHPIVLIKESTTGTKAFFATTSTLSYLWTPSNIPLAFGTNDAERMRIASNGDVLIGTTTYAPASTQGIAIASQRLFVTKSGDAPAYFNRITDTGILIELATSGGLRGSISSNGSTVSYNTSSDYRLKENVAPMTGALAKVAQLKPCTYTWKATGEAGEGFIAHELQAVVPDAVVGEKDAVNEDGSIKPQGIDTSFLVATLTAAIQELKAELDATKAEVQALKGVA